MTDNTLESPARNLSWRIPAIDGLRAIAMLMVYTYHVWEFSDSPAKYVSIFGYRLNLLGAFGTFPAGVDLFMVLSGFCLFLPLCKTASIPEDWNVKNYFARRIRRIVPPYYAAIVYVVLLPVVFVILYRLLQQPAKWQPFPSAWQFLTHLLFIHTFFVSTWSGINGSFWSLGLEAQFYLVFPLVVFGFRRFQTRFLWLMIGASLFYRVLIGLLLPAHSGFWVPGFLYSIFFLGRWMQFALGMAAAIVVARYWKSNQRLSSGLGSAIIVVATGTYILATSERVAGIAILPLRDLLLAICYSGSIIALCVTRTPVKFLFENKAITKLGFISYSFFLIHQPTVYYISVLAARRNIQGINRFFILCSLGFIVVLAISYVFFVLCERPFLNFAKPKRSLVSGSEFLPASSGILTVQNQAVP